MEDCKSEKQIIINNKMKLKNIYLETKELSVIDEFLNDDFVKIIYDISTVNNLKKIEKVIKKYNNNIIYKLPLFNWKSENLKPYLKLLQNQEIMFTRLTQIYLCKDIEFKKRYTDYTVYIWNKNTLRYLKENNIDEFTASPELSYEINKSIFETNSIQVIIGGKMPLVYTRNCFSHLFGCQKCKNNQNNIKNIKNKDKNLDFEILCNDDYRYILNKEPILNDYSKVNLNNNTSFRYISLGQDIESVKNTIKALKNDNYYKELRKQQYWENSYECNLLEGKD